jgi:hypothetical protein
LHFPINVRNQSHFVFVNGLDECDERDTFVDVIEDLDAGPGVDQFVVRCLQWYLSYVVDKGQTDDFLVGDVVVVEESSEFIVVSFLVRGGDDYVEVFAEDVVFGSFEEFAEGA